VSTAVGVNVGIEVGVGVGVEVGVEVGVKVGVGVGVGVEVGVEVGIGVEVGVGVGDAAKIVRGTGAGRMVFSSWKRTPPRAERPAYKRNPKPEAGVGVDREPNRMVLGTFTWLRMVAEAANRMTMK